LCDSFTYYSVAEHAVLSRTLIESLIKDVDFAVLLKLFVLLAILAVFEKLFTVDDVTKYRKTGTTVFL